MAKTYRRFNTEFKLGVVEAYLAGEGCLKGLATNAGVDHSLVHYWLKKYHAGELSLDSQREEASVEDAAALERKVGRLTIELNMQKRGSVRFRLSQDSRVAFRARTCVSAQAFRVCQGEMWSF